MPGAVIHKAYTLLNWDYQPTGSIKGIGQEDMGSGSAKLLLSDSADMAGASASGALDVRYYNTDLAAPGTPNCPEGALYSGTGDIGGFNATYAQCGLGNTLGGIPLKRYISSSATLIKGTASTVPVGRCPGGCRIYDTTEINVVACGKCVPGATLGEFYPSSAHISAWARGLYYSAPIRVWSLPDI